MSVEEGRKVASLLMKVVRKMDVIELKEDDAPEVLKTANELGTTFYDASYFYYAMKLGAPLVTER